MVDKIKSLQAAQLRRLKDSLADLTIEKLDIQATLKACQDQLKIYTDKWKEAVEIAEGVRGLNNGLGERVHALEKQLLERCTRDDSVDELKRKLEEQEYYKKLSHDQFEEIKRLRKLNDYQGLRDENAALTLRLENRNGEIAGLKQHVTNLESEIKAGDESRRILTQELRAHQETIAKLKERTSLPVYDECTRMQNRRQEIRAILPQLRALLNDVEAAIR